jgi:hypothetical protein
VLAHKTPLIALYSQSIMQAAFGEPAGLLEALSFGEHGLATPGHTPIDLGWSGITWAVFERTIVVY